VSLNDLFHNVFFLFRVINTMLANNLPRLQSLFTSMPWKNSMTTTKPIITNILQNTTLYCQFNGTRALSTSCSNRMNLQRKLSTNTTACAQYTLINVLSVNGEKHEAKKTLRCCYSSMDINDEYEVMCEKVWADIQRGDDVYIIDVREPMEVEVYGKIPNSVLIPSENVFDFKILIIPIVLLFNPNQKLRSPVWVEFLYFSFIYLLSCLVGDLENALQLDEDDFAKVYGREKPPDDGDDVIFHCHAGIRSLKATIFARSLGYGQ